MGKRRKRVFKVELERRIALAVMEAADRSNLEATELLAALIDLAVGDGLLEGFEEVQPCLECGEARLVDDEGTVYCECEGRPRDGERVYYKVGDPVWISVAGSDGGREPATVREVNGITGAVVEVVDRNNVIHRDWGFAVLSRRKVR